MLNESSSLHADVFQILEDFSRNNVAEALLPALATSLEQIDDLVCYVLSEKDSILMQSRSEEKLKALSEQSYTLYEDSLTAHYVFAAPKSTVEIKAFGNLVFMILKLHQRDTQVQRQVQRQVQQEQKQALEALKNLRHAQRQLVEAEKIGALGGLMAGMAHELNTPLGIGITALSTLQEEITHLQKAVGDGTLSRNQMENTLRNMQDAGKLLATHLNEATLLIQDFKRVSPRQSYEIRRRIDFKDHLQQIIEAFQHDPKYQHIHFQIKVQDDLWLYTYPNVWTQIINEWVSNARLHGFRDTLSPVITLALKPFQAKPQEGIQALLSLMDQRLKDPKVLPQSKPIHEKPQYWQLLYTDNGEGIEEGLKPIVFEPFSTRSKSAFSGLGLYMVYNLVHQKLDGDLHAPSPLNKGTCFEIIFPHVEEPETNTL